MQRINMTHPGGVDVLYIEDAAIPEPQAGELLIKTAWAGVNRPDIMQREGAYPMPAGVTPIMGLELSGEIVALGADVSGFAVGDRVCALTDGGAYAEYCTVKASQTLPLPAGYSLQEAAMLPETTFTVWANLFMHGQMRTGETLLIHGGTSGIGLTALAIAQALHIRTFATVGNAEKMCFVEAYGATAIHYKTDDFAAIVKAHGGADGILDLVGGRYFAQNLDCLKKDGRLYLIGFMGGNIAPEVDLLKIAVKRAHITGSTLRGRNSDEKAAIAASLRETLWPILADGRVAKPHLHRSYPWREVAAAHTEIDRGTHIGKILLDFSA